MNSLCHFMSMYSRLLIPLAAIWKHSSILIMTISKCVMWYAISLAEKLEKTCLQDHASAYFRKLRIAGRQVGVPLQRLLIVFKLRQCCCSGDEAEVILIPSKIRINTKKCLLWSIWSYKLIPMEEVLYTKVKNCPVQQRICLYGLGMTWPLVGPGLLFEHFFLLQPFATTQQFTSVISHLKAWEAELFQKARIGLGRLLFWISTCQLLQNTVGSSSPIAVRNGE